MVRLNDFTMRDTRVLRTEGGGLVGIIWVLFRGIWGVVEVFGLGPNPSRSAHVQQCEL